MFSLETGLTPTFWIAFAFVCVSFVSSLIFQSLIWKSAKTLDEQFIHFPPITITYIYMIVQIPVGIVFALGSGAIPYKIAIIVNAVLLVVAWVTILAGLAGNDHITKVNGRQKDHHTELN
jgi:hypothetical protein